MLRRHGNRFPDRNTRHAWEVEYADVVVTGNAMGGGATSRLIYSQTRALVREGKNGSMIHRLALCLAGLLADQIADAQEPECRLYKVTADSLTVSKDPRSDAPYTDVLDKATVVCLTREQKAGGRDWGYIPYKLTKPDQRRRVEGWANLRLMQPLSANEI